MPASPLQSLGNIGRIPSWKDARQQTMADTLEGMSIDHKIAQQAASACGDDLNAALDWARAHGASVTQPGLARARSEPATIGSGIGCDFGSGIVSGIGCSIGSGIGSPCESAGDDEADKENGGRVRVWNEKSCKYEWLRGIDAAADEEERQLECMKSPLRKSRSLNGRNMSSGFLKLSLF